MNKADKIKDAVKNKYAQIAQGQMNVIPDINSCCSPKSSCCDTSSSVTNMSQRYEDKDRMAIPEGADLGLGCGTPAAYADLKEGMSVLDLGSGAGIDCFIASKYVGKTGKVIGVDMTEEMIKKANKNKRKAKMTNIEFRLGEIESLPVDNGSIDRVISNCVINLVPDKRKAFSEIFRVLKSGGKFIVSDIVVDGNISDKERHDMSLWAGCISGALSRKEYLGIIEETGFGDVAIVSEKKYAYKLISGGALYSITVSGTK
jgi:arsenite methyltransferase